MGFWYRKVGYFLTNLIKINVFRQNRGLLWSKIVHNHLHIVTHHIPKHMAGLGMLKSVSLHTLITMNGSYC